MAAAATSVAQGARRSTPLVALEELKFTYPDGTEALVGVTFDIPEGVILGLCGPSGCGKSSLLSLLAGIHQPTGGGIRWADGGDKDERHPLTMVFQKDTLLPWLTVEGNVNLYGRLNKGKGRADLVDELIELAGLAGFRKAYPYRLSGGMRRRLAFITAMAAEPRMILLDEPFSALDEPTRIAIHQDVLDIVKRLGTTVVVVTHDLAEAASLCDEVLVLSARPGRVAVRHEVPFGPSRRVMDLRTKPDFLALYGRLWDDLSAQISQSQSKERP